MDFLLWNLKRAWCCICSSKNVFKSKHVSSLLTYFPVIFKYLLRIFLRLLYSILTSYGITDFLQDLRTYDALLQSFQLIQ